ncbi:hypothetical protein, partial [Streptomyces scabiei]|uniref:hypothetical protein n=1 Tax=Streptomyces scabiei TaxID=1930 RepID=UPI0029C0613C
MTEHYARSTELKRGSAARFGSFSDETATTAPPEGTARTRPVAVSCTFFHLHENRHELVCRLLIEKKKKN